MVAKSFAERFGTVAGRHAIGANSLTDIMTLTVAPAIASAMRRTPDWPSTVAAAFRLAVQDPERDQYLTLQPRGLFADTPGLTEHFGRGMLPSSVVPFASEPLVAAGALPPIAAGSSPDAIGSAVKLGSDSMS